MSDLTHDFIQFLIDNYGARLTFIKDEDAERFEKTYPDLMEQMEEEK